jgi:hypothetical protein
LISFGACPYSVVLSGRNAAPPNNFTLIIIIYLLMKYWEAVITRRPAHFLAFCQFDNATMFFVSDILRDTAGSSNSYRSNRKPPNKSRMKCLKQPSVDDEESLDQSDIKASTSVKDSFGFDEERQLIRSHPLYPALKVKISSHSLIRHFSAFGTEMRAGNNAVKFQRLWHLRFDEGNFRIYCTLKLSPLNK